MDEGGYDILTQTVLTGKKQLKPFMLIDYDTYARAEAEYKEPALIPAAPKPYYHPQRP